MRASINRFRVFILPIVSILLILIGLVTVTSAQPFDTVPQVLPPEIMADRYLVEAEQLEAGKDYGGALKVMDKVFAMQKEHNLKLPDEILYIYARIAMSADSVRIALASVNTYLVAAGKQGKFYKEALALSLEAEEELEVPEILAEDTCTGKQRGAECWHVLSSHPGCYVWDEYYYPGYDENYNPILSVTWSGACLDSVARGEGTLTWIRGDDEYSHKGRMRKGKSHGHWVERDERGFVSQGPYVDGARHGSWGGAHCKQLEKKGRIYARETRRSVVGNVQRNVHNQNLSAR